MCFRAGAVCRAFGGKGLWGHSVPNVLYGRRGHFPQDGVRYEVLSPSTTEPFNLRAAHPWTTLKTQRLEVTCRLSRLKGQGLGRACGLRRGLLQRLHMDTPCVLRQRQHCNGPGVRHTLASMLLQGSMLRGLGLGVLQLTCTLL